MFFSGQGKEILHFEEKIGPFIFHVFPSVVESEDQLGDFLLTLLNMIKFNPAYLDPDVVSGLIQILGQICVVNTVKSNIDRCLEVREIFVVDIFPIFPEIEHRQLSVDRLVDKCF